jgi:hypothetical protein
VRGCESARGTESQPLTRPGFAHAAGAARSDEIHEIRRDPTRSDEIHEIHEIHGIDWIHESADGSAEEAHMPFMHVHETTGA